MDIHYNAFISYRHHPVDIKVAEQIHRGLEHYRIPKTLKKNRDTKLRLFRDKEELPITSNLSGDITRALENSDFLIVICSTHTRESLWVQREIETFLQTHDHSRILTVLVDGEPYDTIPEILCSAERVNPVTCEKQLIPIEPLSCDWRGSKRKARREELPRLAAALLGCGYDELRQREKQYRTRRLAAGLTVALAATVAFSAYVIHNSIQISKANAELEKANIEIRKNLEEAQINQSQYLAGAASQQLESGDRMQALALALAALPEFEGQRPYVARAEKALSEAVGVYVSEQEIGAIGCISCDALINRFAATDSRDRMFVYDQRYVLSIWDLRTYGKLRSIQLETSISDLLVTSNDCVIVHLSDNQLRCYDRDLNLLWEQDGCLEVQLSGARDAVLVGTEGNTVSFLDAATGTAVGDSVQVYLQPEDKENYYSITFCQPDYDPARPLILEYSRYGENVRIVGVEAVSGEVYHYGDIPEKFDVRSTVWTEDGNVLVLGAGEEGLWNSRFGNMTTYSKVNNRVWCFSAAGETVWSTELTTYSYSDSWKLYPIPGTGEIFCQIDNLLTILDAETGEVLRQTEVGGRPVWAQPDEDSALVILEDGSIGVFNFDGDDFNSFRYLAEDIGSGFGGKGYFVKQNYSNKILIYGNIMDRNWQMFDSNASTTVTEYAASGNYLAVYNINEVLLFDVAQHKVLWQIPKESGTSFQILGFSEDAKKLWLCNNGKEIICADTLTGEWEHYKLPENTEDGVYLYYSSYYRACMDDGKIYVRSKSLGEYVNYVVEFDTATKKIEILRICAPESSVNSTYSQIQIVKDRTVYFWEHSENALYKANLATGQVEVFMQGSAAQPVVQFLNDGNTCMVAVDHRVTFTEEDGQILFTAEMEDTRGVSAFRMEEEIILLLDSGNFLRFDLTGKRLGEIAGHLYTSFYTDISYQFKPEEIAWTETGDGDLFVNIFNSGNLIDLDGGELRAWVPQCIIYLEELDLFVTTGKDPDTNEVRFGTFRRYSLEEIKEMAREALGEYTLTNEQMESYGIS